VIAALGVQCAEAIVERAQAAFDARVIAREAIKVREDRLAGAATSGVVLQAIEAEEAQMLNGDAIHQELFVGSAGVVLFMQRRTETLEDRSLAWPQMGQEELVGGTKAVLQGIHAGLGFAFRGRGHGKKG
jgi:hypothetical protein